MTISANLSTVTRNGNGVATSFSFPFKVWDVSQLDVYITDPAGVTTSTSNFTVTLSGTGGNVVYPASGGTVLPTGWKIVINRSMPFTQNVDLVNGQAFYPDVIEQALDELTATCQQLDEGLSRSVKVEPGQTDPAALLTQIQAAVTNSGNSSTAAASSASAAADSKVAAAASAAAAQAAAATLSPATTTSRGIGRVATSDDLVDGATITNGPAFLAAGVNTSVAAAAGKVPVADGNNHLALGWFGSMLCNVRTVITVSGTFTVPISGWYRVKCIGGGGAGGGAPIHGGGGGGTTSFGAYLSAIGGSGGSGNGRPGYYDACGGSGGGGAGKVTTALIYLAKDTSVTVTIGAGGVCSTTYNTMPTGIGAPVPAYDVYSSARGAIGAKGAGNGTTTSYDGTTGTHYNGIGGNGGRNGTGYGGGGGGAGSTRGTGGLGADGGADGAIGTSSSTVSVQGGTGGNGAVIVEYFDPAIAA